MIPSDAVLLEGRSWVRVGGTLKQIESGPNGVVWGVNRWNNIYYRAGINKRRPLGTSWIRIGGKLKHISPGCIGVYGLNTRGYIYIYRGKGAIVYCRNVKLKT